MARILCTVPPLIGHLNPALAVAAALEARGHIVAWVVHGDRVGSHLPVAAQRYPLGAYDEAVAERYRALRGPESLRYFHEEYMVRMARDSFDALEAALLDFRPDLLLVDQHMVAGALAARKHGLPWVTLAATSAALMAAAPQFEDWLRQLLLHLQEDLLPSELHRARPDLSPHGVLVFSVRELAEAAGERAMQPCFYVGPAGSAARREIEFPWEWLNPNVPAVLATLGTVSRDSEPRFFEVLFDAAAALDIQVVAVAPEALAVKAPANVLVQPYVPQPELLQRMAGVVCHAGHNTVCEALAAGLPLALAPILGDQPYVARQVIAAGAGIPLRFGKVSVPVMRAALERLLSDAVLRTAAQRLAEALHAAPGAAGAADVIETVLAGDPTVAADAVPASGG